MSSVIRGSRFTPATFRCPPNLLRSAVQWEQLRASYYLSLIHISEPTRPY